MAIFRFFKTATTATLSFKIFDILPLGKLKRMELWTPCQISSKSVRPRPRYGDFSIFQDGGRRHLGFLNFCNFNSRNAQGGETVSLCQIAPKSAKPRPKYGDFSIL